MGHGLSFGHSLVASSSGDLTASYALSCTLILTKSG
jgi:hypothetical protein